MVIMKNLFKWLCLSGFAVFFGCETKHMTSTPVYNREDSLAQIPWHPLRNDLDLDILLDAIGSSRVVLLGGSTHGTHEFYQWWTSITKRLVEEKGFNIIAIEGDWTDSYTINQFVHEKFYRDNNEVSVLLKQYNRWPSFMWGNKEMASLINWLAAYRDHNKIGFYGLDIYSFWEWTKKQLPPQYASLQKKVNRLRDSFDLYNDDALKYTSDVKWNKADKSNITADLWDAVQRSVTDTLKEEGFVLQQQALLALEAERYFRTAVTDKVKAWNIRAGYMAITVERLLRFYGSGSKAIIWVHNTHAGDTEYSQMAGADSSVAQLLNERLGRDHVFSIGFGSNTGMVLAGKHWNEPAREIKMPSAITGSWENVLHKIGNEDKIILSSEIQNNRSLQGWIDFRSVGVVYDGIDGYGRAIIPLRFDAFIYIDSTTALRPIGF
jgi:erythromycin esterase-like protein